ncbi:MAG TPA: RHS repeat-associated core domain-containing protein [Longimicrobium sp.]|jgi:RHS repeat-associated protein
MRLTFPRVPARWCIATAICCIAAVPLAAQTPPLPSEVAAAHTHRDVVRALYERVLERTPGDDEVLAWTPYLAAGYTPRHLAQYIADSQEYRDRFITPENDSRTVATLLYRHILAREPDAGGRAFWAAHGETYGWSSVIQLLVWSEEFRLLFSDFGVPGRPVTVWDGRAALMLEPSSGSPTTERDLCLAVGAGAGAAAECGDLRLAHALPAVRALGKTHAPVLLYNSEHSGERFPLLAARVTPPPSMGVLERVEVVLWLQDGNGWHPRGRRIWEGAALAAWTPGQPRRVAFRLPYAGPTGLYKYRVEAIFHAGGNAWGTDQLGQTAVVNRLDSPFGRGWWVAGLERLVALGDHLYWIGGDGSTKLYRPAGGVPGVWVGPTVDRPDTIVGVTASIYSGAAYERRLPGRTRVYFDVSGRHIATVNRLDQHTRFTYNGAGRLETIEVPLRPGGSGEHWIAYRFHYTAGGRLDHVTAPDHFDHGARQVAVLGDPADPGRISGFVDPDGSQVRFEYDGAGRIAARVDRRGTRTVFSYDAGGKLSLAHVLMRGTGDDIVTRFTAAESRGLAPSDTVGQPVPVAEAFTLIDGPRGDVADHTRLWLDRWGGPWLVQNALGYVSSLTRGDWRFPALVTQTKAPNGLLTRAWYNARGMPDSVTVVRPLDTSENATTRYAYENPHWPDFATRITLPQGEVAQMGYDSASGNRVWQQDIRGESSRVVFGYHHWTGPHAGLLHTVTTPATPDHGPATEAYEYDGAGNLFLSIGPLADSTTYHNDALGRTVRVVFPRPGEMQNPADSAFQVTLYDEMDRVKRTESVGPAMRLPRDSPDTLRLTPGRQSPAERVLVENFYDAAGQLDSVARWSVPDPNEIGVMTTRWRYDAAGRTVAEIGEVSADTAWEVVCGDPGNLGSCHRVPSVALTEVGDSTVYDPAGNAVAVHTRRGHTITSEFDALNRLRRRIVPPVAYSRDTLSVVGTTWIYPYFQQLADGTFLGTPNPGFGGVTIPGDVAEFEYDTAGNIVRADNGDARVRRQYYPNGLLRSETQQLRAYAGGDFSAHTYTLGYEYDLNGRRTAVIHPAQLAPAGGTGRTEYHHALHAALDTVRDVMGGRFVYRWNPDGSLASRISATEQTFTYDLGGRLAHRVEMRGTTPVHDETYAYDLRGKTLSVVAAPERQRILNRYTGLGALTYSYTRDQERELRTAEEYVLDALANQQLRLQDSQPLTDLQNNGARDGESYFYQRGTGRLALRVAGDLSSRPTGYDAAGNQQTSVTKRPIRTKYDEDQGGITLFAASHSYYDAEQRLRVHDRRACLLMPAGGCYADGEMPPVSERSAFEEYRYDALGRRVLTRARQEVYCHDEGGPLLPDCIRSVVRTVWDGDQILYEVSAPGGSGVDPQDMERDVGHRVSAISRYFGYGRVAYAHGLGIDDPLSVIRVEYSDSIPWPVRIVPSSNWAGRYDGGSGGECITVGPAGRQIRPVVWSPGEREGVISPGWGEEGEQMVHCTEIDWPALGMWMNLDYKPSNFHGRHSWMGSLLQHGRDPSGQYYRRNRFYDASTGRFTQEDPIGLSGGLNLYGFADGDPVSYSDPYGLCPEPGELSGVQDFLCQTIEALTTAGGAHIGANLASGPALAQTAGSEGVLAPAAAAQVVAGGATGAMTGKLVGEAITNVLFSRSSTSGNNAAAQRGREAHRQYSERMQAGGYQTNRRIPGTRLLPDALDRARGIIRELKPNTPRAIARGRRQLQRYVEAAERAFKKPFEGHLDTY